MNVNRTLRILVLVLAALSLFTGLSNAQDYQGEFTLPFEAHWGRAVLPAGHYSLRLDPLVAPFVIALRRGNQNVALVMPSEGPAERKSSEPSALLAVRINGKYRIRSLSLAQVGLVFYYSVPKSEQRLVAQGPVLIRRIPISAAGK